MLVMNLMIKSTFLPIAFCILAVLVYCRIYIVGSLLYSKTSLLLSTLFYLQFIKEGINLSWSTSPKVMKERILLLSHFCTSQAGLIVSIAEITWHCKYFLGEEKLLLWLSKWAWTDYKYGNYCKCPPWCTAQSI